MRSLWNLLKKFHCNYVHSFTDQEKSSASSEDCSRGIYFKLTLLFGGIICFAFIVLLILAIIREHRRQKHKKGKLFTHGQKYDVKPQMWNDHSKIALTLFFSLSLRVNYCLFLYFVPVSECQAQQHDDKVNSTRSCYSKSKG